MRTGRQRGLLGVAALCVLLVAVAIASSGSVPAGSTRTRGPSDQAMDVLISMFLVMMAFGTLFVAYVLLLRRKVIADVVATRRRRSRWVTVAALLVGFGLLALFVRLLSSAGGPNTSIADRLFFRQREGRSDAAPSPDDYRPEFATRPVLVILGLVALAVTAWVLSARARRRTLAPVAESPLPALADVLDETLDDLRAERDPRRAVVASYARMERTLAAYGLPRGPAEAPAEYLGRIFDDLEVGRRATSHLTSLFSRAKFSSHDVDIGMKEAAISALESVRDDLRAADLAAELERMRALAARLEREDR